MICISVYYTRNLKIEVLSNDTVKLTNNREDGKIYILDAKPFYQLLKVGGKQWKIPNRHGGYTEISFNISNHPAGKHLSNAGGGINTYISLNKYESLMHDLEALTSTTTLVGINMNSSEYLSPKEASKFLGVSTHLLQKWRTLGVGIAYMKLGQSKSSVIRYQKSDILEYLDNNKIKTL